MKKYVFPVLFYFISSVIITIPLPLALFCNLDSGFFFNLIDLLKFKFHLLTLFLLSVLLFLFLLLDSIIYRDKENFKDLEKNITALIGDKNNIFLNFILSFFGGYFEELFFRGYLFLLFKLFIPNIFVNIFIISAIFGFLHITQKTFGVIFSFSVSVLFFISLLLSKTVIYAIFFHIIFNFIELSFIFPMKKAKFSLLIF